jgi:hypothetical protein
VNNTKPMEELEHEHYIIERVVAAIGGPRGEVAVSEGS